MHSCPTEYSVHPSVQIDHAGKPTNQPTNQLASAPQPHQLHARGSHSLLALLPGSRDEMMMTQPTDRPQTRQAGKAEAGDTIKGPVVPRLDRDSSITYHGAQHGGRNRKHKIRSVSHFSQGMETRCARMRSSGTLVCGCRKRSNYSNLFACLLFASVSR